MARKRKTSWVFDEWNQLVLAEGDRLPPEVRQQRRDDLHRRTYVDGQWVVPIHDAKLVAGLGFFDAMIAGDYPLARSFARQFMAHPDFTPEALGWEYFYYTALEASADLLSGNIEQALERMRWVLKSEPRRKNLVNVR